MRGFKQYDGGDFSEIFSPTVSNSCVRLRGVSACECDFDLTHFDVDQALLSLISKWIIFCDYLKDAVIFPARWFDSIGVRTN